MACNALSRHFDLFKELKNISNNNLFSDETAIFLSIYNQLVLILYLSRKLSDVLSTFESLSFSSIGTVGLTLGAGFSTIGSARLGSIGSLLLAVSYTHLRAHET